MAGAFVRPSRAKSREPAKWGQWFGSAEQMPSVGKGPRLWEHYDGRCQRGWECDRGYRRRGLAALGLPCIKTLVDFRNVDQVTGDRIKRHADIALHHCVEIGMPNMFHIDVCGRLLEEG